MGGFDYFCVGWEGVDYWSGGCVVVVGDFLIIESRLGES